MNKANTKRVSDIIGMDDIKTWTAKNIIIISAGTGRGKSYFIKNSLYQYAKENGKKILFLIHRSNCAVQFKNEIESDKKDDVIDIFTYQKIEYDILNYDKHIDYRQYAYIVCDEFHYFISDADFNKTTDVSFMEIMRQRNCIKIFMSATGEDVENYLSDNYKQKVCKYELMPDYSYVSTLTFFSQYEDMEYLAEKFIFNQKKAIFFIQSAEKAYKLYKKYSQHSLFNCSKSNSHYKYVDKEAIEQMLRDERFNENLLITTACFDAGANIVDKDVKYIVADITDIGSLIQCLGRKRSQSEEDKVSFFIKAVNNQKLSGLRSSAQKNIEMAEYLLSHNTQELILKYPRQVDKNSIIYDDTKKNNQKNMSTKKVNMMIYKKKKSNIDLYTSLMKTSFGFCKYMAKYLGFQDEEGHYTYLTFSKDYSLKAFLQRYVDENIVMLQVKDRKPLIDKLNVRSVNRKQLKGLDSLNAALEELGLPYQIVQFMTNRNVDGKSKKYKQAWRVEKIDIN